MNLSFYSCAVIGQTPNHFPTNLCQPWFLEKTCETQDQRLFHYKPSYCPLYLDYGHSYEQTQDEKAQLRLRNGERERQFYPDQCISIYPHQLPESHVHAIKIITNLEMTTPVGPPTTHWVTILYKFLSLHAHLMHYIYFAVKQLSCFGMSCNKHINNFISEFIALNHLVVPRKVFRWRTATA